MSNDEADAILPGTVWWCDGASLAFEAYFKRRPVLVLGENGNGLLVVAPLSSKRRFGQEQAVTHSGGVSFLTGQIRTVPPEALLSPLGAWDGFAVWQERQQNPPPSLSLFDRLRFWRTRTK